MHMFVNNAKKSLVKNSQYFSLLKIIKNYGNSTKNFVSFINSDISGISDFCFILEPPISLIQKEIFFQRTNYFKKWKKLAAYYLTEIRLFTGDSTCLMKEFVLYILKW